CATPWRLRNPLTSWDRRGDWRRRSTGLLVSRLPTNEDRRLVRWPRCASCSQGWLGRRRGSRAFVETRGARRFDRVLYGGPVHENTRQAVPATVADAEPQLPAGVLDCTPRSASRAPRSARLLPLACN